MDALCSYHFSDIGVGDHVSSGLVVIKTRRDMIPNHSSDNTALTSTRTKEVRCVFVFECECE